MGKRPYPTTEERTDEVVALRARVEELERHRRQWRGYAMRLHDALRNIYDEYNCGPAFKISRDALAWERPGGGSDE